MTTPLAHREPDAPAVRLASGLRRGGVVLLGLSLLGCTTAADFSPSSGPPARPLDDADAADTDSGTDSDADPDGGAEDERDAFIFGLGHLDIEALTPKTETECIGDCPVDGQEADEWCSYVHYSETVHAHDFVAFQPNSATLWPGNVLQGEDAQHGLLTPISLERAPMKFSVSLENLGGSPVGEMSSPSLSSFRQERNRVLESGTTGKTPAKISYSMHRVFDETQVAVALGASIDWFRGRVSTMFDFSSTSQATKILVDFSQAYYTIDVDTPGLPTDLFTDAVTLEQVESFMGEGNPPVYVQSITYGRRVVFSIESSFTEDEVRFALEAGFNAFFADAELELETQHRTILEQSKISALVLGGAGSEAVKTVTGFEGLIEYIQAGGDYSKDSPGAEIAYKLAYLDNTGVRLALTTDYSERQCYDNFIDVSGGLARLEYLGGNDDGPVRVHVYGDIEFRVAEASDADPCRADAPGWQSVFHRTDRGTQTVEGQWVPSSPPTAQIFDLAVDPANSLCLRGELREDDDCLFCNDDDFGEAALGPIPLSAGWAGDHILEFSGEGTVVATVRITVD